MDKLDQKFEAVMAKYDLAILDEEEKFAKTAKKKKSTRK